MCAIVHRSGAAVAVGHLKIKSSKKCAVNRWDSVALFRTFIHLFFSSFSQTISKSIHWFGKSKLRLLSGKNRINENKLMFGIIFGISIEFNFRSLVLLIFFSFRSPTLTENHRKDRWIHGFVSHQLYWARKCSLKWMISKNHKQRRIILKFELQKRKSEHLDPTFHYRYKSMSSWASRHPDCIAPWTVE